MRCNEPAWLVNTLVAMEEERVAQEELRARRRAELLWAMEQVALAARVLRHAFDAMRASAADAAAIMRSLYAAWKKRGP